MAHYLLPNGVTLNLRGTEPKVTYIMPNLQVVIAVKVCRWCGDVNETESEHCSEECFRSEGGQL